MTIISTTVGKLWRRKWQLTPVFLSEKSHGQMSLASYNPKGWKESDMTEYLHCGQECLRRNGVSLIVSERVWHALLWCNLKNDRMVSVHFQGKPFSITAIQTMLQPLMQKKVEVECFYEDIQEFLELAPKRYHLQHRGLRPKKKKKRKSRDIWSIRQVWSWSRKWIRAKAKWVLSREYTLFIANPLPKTQETTLHNSTHVEYHMVNTEIRLIIFFCSQRWRSSIKLAKSRPGEDCGSDHQLLTSKFRLMLKKVGKSTTQLRYDVNQIPYDCLHSGGDE